MTILNTHACINAGNSTFPNNSHWASNLWRVKTTTPLFQMDHQNLHDICKCCVRATVHSIYQKRPSLILSRLIESRPWDNRVCVGFHSSDWSMSHSPCISHQFRRAVQQQFCSNELKKHHKRLRGSSAASKHKQTQEDGLVGISQQRSNLPLQRPRCVCFTAARMSWVPRRRLRGRLAGCHFGWTRDKQEVPRRAGTPLRAEANFG